MQRSGSLTGCPSTRTLPRPGPGEDGIGNDESTLTTPTTGQAQRIQADLAGSGVLDADVVRPFNEASGGTAAAPGSIRDQHPAWKTNHQQPDRNRRRFTVREFLEPATIAQGQISVSKGCPDTKTTERLPRQRAK